VLLLLLLLGLSSCFRGR